MVAAVLPEVIAAVSRGAVSTEAVLPEVTSIEAILTAATSTALTPAGVRVERMVADLVVALTWVVLAGAVVMAAATTEAATTAATGGVASPPASRRVPWWALPLPVRLIRTTIPRPIVRIQTTRTAACISRLCRGT